MAVFIAARNKHKNKLNLPRAQTEKFGKDIYEKYKKVFTEGQTGAQVQLNSRNEIQAINVFDLPTIR